MGQNRRERPAYGVRWTEIEVEGEGKTGTGQFQVALENFAFEKNARIATTAHVGTINIGVSLQPAQNQVIVLFGDGARGNAKIRKAFQLLPSEASNGSDHEFLIFFKNWDIRSVRWNTNDLQEIPERED
jgi:hypothetical protein